MGQLGAIDPPLFASPEWCQSHGPTMLASALRAALAWAHDRDPHVIAARYDVELGAAWRHQERDYDEWRRIAEKVRGSADWATHSELQRRRAS